jgi:hypothetical protein
MLRWAHLPQVLFAALALHVCAQSQIAQGTEASKQIQDKQAETQEQAALALLEQVLAGVKNLTLPQNRIAIEAEAFPLVWSHSEAQARSLVSQIEGEFAQAAGQQEQSTDFNFIQQLRGQRQTLVQTIAQSDAQLALEFLAGTRAYVRAGTPEEDEEQERQLRLLLAAQEATRNPRHALEMAEKDLRAPGDLPYELINLLNQVMAGDKQAGAQLFRDIVTQVKNRDLVNNAQDFNFAVNLLSTRNNADANDKDVSELHGLADAIASAALSPQFPQNMLSSLNGIQTTLQQLTPGRTQAIEQKLQTLQQTLSPEQKIWQSFNEAQASGNMNRLLAVAGEAPVHFRSNLYQQIAWRFANDGDYEDARRIADNITNPFQRNQALQQALRQAAWGASNKEDFVRARQFAEQIMPEEERATLLAQLALNAANAKQPAAASEILEEAVALLGNRLQTMSQFGAQLQVAETLIRMKPGQAVQILERCANQLEQILGTAVQLDGFLPYQRSFEQGELIVNHSFLFNSLVAPYLRATSQLANGDVATARMLADRLTLPEVRLMAELAVARSALGQGGAVAIVYGTIGGS